MKKKLSGEERLCGQTAKSVQDITDRLCCAAGYPSNPEEWRGPGA
jgi:hypothetical protein